MDREANSAQCWDDGIVSSPGMMVLLPLAIIIIARPRTASINAIYKSKYIATAN